MNWYKRKKIADSAHNLYEYLCHHPVKLKEEDIFNSEVDVPPGFHVDQVSPGRWAGFAPEEADNVMLVAPEPTREHAKTLMKRRVYYILLDLAGDSECRVAV